MAWSFEMRIAACALMALALGAGEAAAQCYGPECDSRSGPARPYYYTDPGPGPGAGFERPPYRGPEPGFEAPQYRPAPPDDRMRREYRSDIPPSRPPAYKPANPRPDTTYERSTRAPDTRRDVWGDRVPPAAPRDNQRRAGNEKPTAGTVTISIAEYEDLRNRARELQRLLGERRDFHDVPSRPTHGPGPSTIYR
jgi:hypothetical protein